MLIKYCLIKTQKRSLLFLFRKIPSSVASVAMIVASSRLLKNVYVDELARQKIDEKAEFIIINELFESIFNAARASKLVFQQPA